MSKVVVTVNSVPLANQAIYISDTGRPDIEETFQDYRNNTIGVTQLEPVSDPPSTVAIAWRLMQNINKDYNALGIYTLTFDYFTSSFTIESDNATFAESINTTLGAVSMVITNTAVETPFVIDSVQALEATTNPCDNVQLVVTTNLQATDIREPINASVNQNPIVFEVPRSEIIRLKVLKNGVEATKRLVIPHLYSSYFEVEKITVPSQNYVKLIKLPPINSSLNYVTYEYRLDGGVWGSTANYYGLSVGAHTISVRDNLGCQIDIDFDIDAFVPNLVDYDPIAEISNVNPFRFKLNETISNNGIRRNINNSLSFEENTDINNRDFKQIWQTSDYVSTQIKTNYSNIEAALIDCQGVETSLSLTTVTDNMDKTDVRDGTIRIQEDNSVGVSFVAGNTYDKDTLAQNGSYNIGASVMDWINAGDWINIEGQGWYTVKSIKSPTIDADYRIVILNVSNYDLGLTDATKLKITTVYNVVDYNRYEFTVDMSALSNDYYIKVNFTDTNYEDKEFVSEWFNVQEQQEENHFVIDYYNSENNEINYATGISFRLRIPYVLPLKWKPNNEQDVYITDTKTVLIDSKVREFYEFTLKPLPVAIAQKITLALSHDKISIDGITYLLEGQLDVVSFGATNLYQLKGTLIRSDYVFENTTGITLSEILLPSETPLKIDKNADGLLLLK